MTGTDSVVIQRTVVSDTIIYWFHFRSGELLHRKQQRQKKLRMEKKRELKIAAGGRSSYSSARYASK